MSYLSGFVNVIVVLLPNFSKGLNADGQLASICPQCAGTRILHNFTRSFQLYYLDGQRNTFLTAPARH